MKIIDRHILKNFLIPFVYILISLLGLFLAYDVSSKTARFLKYHVPLLAILRYYSLYVPHLGTLGLPMVILMAIVLGVGKISKSNEITALRACGVSVLRIASPLFVAGLLLAGTGFLMFEKVITKTYGETRRLEQELEGKKPTKDVIRNGYFPTDESGSLLHFTSYRPERNRFELLWWETESEDPPGKILVRAQRAAWTEDSWWAFGVNIIYPDGAHSLFYRKMKMYEWDFRPEEVTGEKFPEEMSFAELQRNIRKFRVSPDKVRKLQTQLHQRIAIPLLNLMVVAVALPFAVRGGKRGGSVAIGVGICMLLCMGYYALCVLMSLLRPIPVWIAVWFPNLLFGGGGLTATLRMD